MSASTTSTSTPGVASSATEADAWRAANSPVPFVSESSIVAAEVAAQGAADVGPVTVGRKVAIIGYTDSRHEAPYGEPGWEMWGLNNLHVQVTPEQMPSFTRWYDLHDRATILADERHVEWLARTTLPVFMWRPDPAAWPTTVEFPRDLLVEQFGRYFTNSISWMIAHAIVEGATEIGVWGVDMAQSTEYAAQRPSCEYFLGLAAGLGITVTIADTSDLLKAAVLYGESDGGLRAKLEQRSAELGARISSIGEQINGLTQAQLQLMGAKESNDYILGVWTQPAARREAGGPRDPHLEPLTQE